MTDAHDISRLSQLDLNLLHVFDVVAREGNLSEAARGLSVTQSAVSHAIARLRDQLGDPLFVRQGRGVAPTPLAERLAPAIRQAMAVLERALAARGAFDPGLDVPRLTLALPDEVEPMVLPVLRARLARTAPGLVLASVRIDRPRMRADLWNRKLDAALDVPQHPRQPQLRRQLRERAVEPPELGACLRRQRGVGDLLQPRVVCAAIEAEPRQEPATPKAPVHLMHGDAHQPGAEARAIEQPRQVMEGGHEHVLHHVLGLGRAREQPGH